MLHYHIATVPRGEVGRRTYKHGYTANSEIQAKAEILYWEQFQPTPPSYERVVVECSLTHDLR